MQLKSNAFWSINHTYCNLVFPLGDINLSRTSWNLAKKLHLNASNTSGPHHKRMKISILNPESEWICLCFIYTCFQRGRNVSWDTLNKIRVRTCTVRNVLLETSAVNIWTPWCSFTTHQNGPMAFLLIIVNLTKEGQMTIYMYGAKMHSWTTLIWDLSKNNSILDIINQALDRSCLVYFVQIWSFDFAPMPMLSLFCRCCLQLELIPSDRKYQLYVEFQIHPHNGCFQSPF